MLEAALAGLAGLLIGSFLNVCIYRKARDLSIVKPRSFCPSCSQTISWYDNVPLLSYLILRGRCRQCGHRISWRYPFVEALTAVLFSGEVLAFGPTLQAAKYCVFVALQIVLIFTDLESRTLHEDLTLGGTLAGLIFAWWVPVPSAVWELILPFALPSRLVMVLEAALGAVVLAGMLWLIGVLHSRLRHTESLGFGDVEMTACIGAFLGLSGGLAAVMIGSVLGSLISIPYLLLTRKDRLTYQLPFGSFLGIGAIAATFQAAFLLVTRP